jgi:hypothetical protein
MRVVAGVTLSVALAAPLLAVSVSPAGDWAIDFALEGTTTPGQLRLTLLGETVGGSVFTQHTGSGTVRGTWKEPELHMTFTFESHESIEVDGDLRDGVLTGEFRTEGRRGTWRGTRGSRGASGATSHGEAQYAPYAFLIGEWSVGPEGGTAVGIARFKWGPNHSYIWCSQSLLAGGQEEPHFEGMLLWNGVHKNLDMLVAIDLHYGLAQEQGTLTAAADGTLTRDITAVFSAGVQPLGMAVAGPEGTTAHFRQTFRATGDRTVATSVMRETDKGWTATFPGSDRMVMTRRD